MKFRRSVAKAVKSTHFQPKSPVPKLAGKIHILQIDEKSAQQFGFLLIIRRFIVKRCF